MKKRMVSVIVMVALFLNSILGMTEMTYAGTEAIKTKEEAYINKSVKSVTNNGSTTAAITTDGDLYCWGQNDYGQVGNGTITDQTSPQKVLSNVESVCLGNKNSAVITTNSDLYCWGKNDCGQVGNGTEVNQASPQKVLSNVKSVFYNNVRWAVITISGDLYCWGKNNYGQVGNGATINQTSPVKILSDVKSVCLGYKNNAAITINEDLYCWGENNYGQVGNGTTIKQTSPIKVLGNIKSVSLSDYNSAAITTDGDLYCWGKNDDGQVGNGITINQARPIKILSNVKSVSLSGYNSAAITENGDLYCWGSNGYGQVGNGTTKNQLKPKKILSNVDSVFWEERNGAAITTDRDLYHWGDNTFGQIGNGTIADRGALPVKPIKILNNVKLLNLDFYLPCYNAVTINGDLYCFGQNGQGQVGNGTTKTQITPVRIFSIFNEYTYRANHLTNTSISPEGSEMEKLYINTVAQSEIMVRELQKNGGANAVEAWNILIKTCEAALDPSKIQDYIFEEKDIYSAIILNVLESASKYGIVDIINADIITDTNELLQIIKSNLKLEYSLEIYEDTKNSTFTKNMRLRTMELVGEYFEKNNKVPKAVEWLDNFINIMDYVDTFEDAIEEIVAYINIRNLNDSIKTVLKEMKNNCPSDNKALSVALSECLNILEASDTEFAHQMAYGAYKTIGTKVAKHIISKFWNKFVIQKIESICPQIAIIITAYKSSQYFTNRMFNVDEIAEKYYKMIAIAEFDSVTRETYQSLKKTYLKNPTVDNAKAYLSVIDILSNTISYDCDCAYEYVECIESATINKICTFFGCGPDYDAIKSSIDHFKTDINTKHKRVLTNWVNYLEEDFPLEYDKYKKILNKNLQRVKEYKAHCPVDVYVYDSKNTLVASVINNIPSTSGISVVVENDEKTFYLPEGEEYSFTYIGNDTGVMDIEILERDTNDTILRNTTFNNIALSKGETYNSDENGKFMESAQYAIVSSNNEKKEADFDSYKKDEKPTHTISIEQGTIFSNGVPSYTLDACENEMLDISAYIPIGYELDTWKVLSGNIQIKDINNANTKIIVGNENVTIKAVLKKVRFKYGDVNSDGEVNIQDGVILKKYLADIKGLNINMDASDVNGDGRVNISDAVILMKHLAGMSVNLGKAVNK